jgi:DNA-binding NtrC family response regulator
MSGPNVAQKTVLVADDDDLVRGVVRMALTRDGLRVVEAHDAESVLQVASDHWPAVVILDVNMPGGGIDETLAALTTRHPDVAVLVMSGAPLQLSGVAGLHIDFALKPLDREDLLSRVHRLLSVAEDQE